MNARDAINFLKSPTGKIVAFCLAGVAILALVSGFKKAKADPSLADPPSKSSASSQIEQSTDGDVAPFHLAPSDTKTSGTLRSGLRPAEAMKPDRLSISLYAESPSAQPQIKPLGKRYAPYGRLIPCELIVTVDSAKMRTPIIGLVTEDVYHAGQLVIPAGTEVHGTAQTDPTRERIASGSHWTLVWQNGEELSLNGIALDREEDPNGSGWGITDGSAGLRGRIIKSDSLAEIKLFAAAFLSGAAGALTERQPTIIGPIATQTVQNGSLEGAESVLGTYAQQILNSIERDGFYVRVPAGKQFYLYVTQTIDQSDAKVGGTRFDRLEANSALESPPIQSPYSPQPRFAPNPP
ncbi:MAG: TrbI/VirB10 family protein [Limisphaerales bacterium]